MDLKILINRIQALILKPEKEWISINTEEHSFRDLFIDYAGPLMTLGSITLFIHDLLLEYSWPGKLIHSLLYFLCIFSSMYIASLIITELSANFGIEKDKNKIFKLVIYSSTALYLTKAVINLHDQLSILYIFSLYSVYLFWLGSEAILRIDDKRKMGFVVISVLIIFLTYELLQRIVLNIFENLNLLV